MAQVQVRANGNINVASFVKLDSTKSDTVIQATAATDQTFGIASPAADTPPIPGAATVAAVAGEAIQVYQPGSNNVCLLQAGTAGWTNGDLLAAGASGYGYTATSGQYYGARAVSTVAANGLGTVRVEFGKN